MPTPRKKARSPCKRQQSVLFAHPYASQFWIPDIVASEQTTRSPTAPVNAFTSRLLKLTCIVTYFKQIQCKALQYLGRAQAQAPARR